MPNEFGKKREAPTLADIFNRPTTEDMVKLADQVNVKQAVKEEDWKRNEQKLIGDLLDRDSKTTESAPVSKKAASKSKGSPRGRAALCPLLFGGGK